MAQVLIYGSYCVVIYAIFSLNGKTLKLLNLIIYLGSNISSTESDLNIHWGMDCYWHVIEHMEI